MEYKSTMAGHTYIIKVIVKYCLSIHYALYAFDQKFHLFTKKYKVQKSREICEQFIFHHMFILK